MGMSKRKINEVLSRYEQTLKTIENVKGLDEQYTHLREMIPKMRSFLEEGRTEKTFRWLGFMQGVFYSKGYYTIDQMANHSRPTKSDLRADFPDHAFLDGCSCHNCKEYEEAPDTSPE